MKNSKVQFITTCGIIAALYAVLTVAVAPLGFGVWQFRVSEALTILPVFTPAAIPGLFLGCIVANIYGLTVSALGPMDIIFGSLASLIAALLTYAVRNIKLKGVPFLAPLPPILVNAVIIGAEFCVVAGNFTPGFFFLQAGPIALGQTIACYVLGIPLYLALAKLNQKHPILR